MYFLVVDLVQYLGEVRLHLCVILAHLLDLLVVDDNALVGEFLQGVDLLSLALDLLVRHVHLDIVDLELLRCEAE